MITTSSVSVLELLEHNWPGELYSSLGAVNKQVLDFIKSFFYLFRTTRWKICQFFLVFNKVKHNKCQKYLTLNTIEFKLYIIKQTLYNGYILKAKLSLIYYSSEKQIKSWHLLVTKLLILQSREINKWFTIKF